MPERSPRRLAPRPSLSTAGTFALLLALGAPACGPSATQGAGDPATTPTPTPVQRAEAGPAGEDPGPQDPSGTPVPERLPTPTCDAASAPLHALRQAAAGTIAEPGDIDGVRALLGAIDRELGGERGETLSAELGAVAKDRPPSAEALARLNALLALWFRDQLRRAVELEIEAERNLAWARAECSWALIAAEPSLLRSLAEERLGEIIQERLIAGRTALLAEDPELREGWRSVVFPARQAIEKRLFTAAQRTLLREASSAQEGADEAAAQRARAASLLIRDRLQDKNTPAIAPIEAMLEGPPAAIDLPMLERALAITFAKRSRKYCSEVVLKPELVGEATGLSSVTEGMTYSRLILPDMSARLGDAGFSGSAYIDTWEALLEEIAGGHDAGEIRRLSDELVRWNCAYQEALGIAECTWNRDEVAR